MENSRNKKWIKLKKIKMKNNKMNSKIDDFEY